MSNTKNISPSFILIELAKDMNAANCSNNDTYDNHRDRYDHFSHKGEQSGESANDKQKSSRKIKYEDRITNAILTIKSHPSLVKYGLRKKDIILLSRMWELYLEGRVPCLDFSDIMEIVQWKGRNEFQCQKYIIDLLERNVLSFYSTGKSDYHINTLVLRQSEYQLHSEILFDIAEINFQSKLIDVIDRKYCSNNHFLRNLVAYLDMIFSSYRELDFNFLNSHSVFVSAIINNTFTLLINAIETDWANTNFSIIIKSNRLDHIEKTILLLLYYFHKKRNESVTQDELLCYISTSYQDSLNKMDYLSKTSKLLSKKLVTLCDGDGIFTRPGYEIESSILRKIESESLSPLEDIAEEPDIKDDNRFSYIDSSQTIDELILPITTIQTLSASLHKFRNSKECELDHWGLRKPSISLSHFEGKQAKHEKPRLMILLYGYPGTGKTYAAGAIANTLKTKLISLDSSKLRDKYYGETQQIVKNTFEKIRSIVLKSTNPPVFLLNEADQLIHARVNLMHGSSGQTENAIQNIILEELETLPGIFIATTNQIEFLDEAFLRRFHLKIEFGKPDYECRLKLWKLHIPNSIPGSEAMNMEFLARQYDITGGQIRIIVENACSEAVSRTKNRQKLEMDDLMKYAEMETLSMGKQYNRAIGFSKPIN